MAAAAAAAEKRMCTFRISLYFYFLSVFLSTICHLKKQTVTFLRPKRIRNNLLLEYKFNLNFCRLVCVDECLCVQRMGTGILSSWKVLLNIHMDVWTCMYVGMCLELILFYGHVSSVALSCWYVQISKLLGWSICNKKIHTFKF